MPMNDTLSPRQGMAWDLPHVPAGEEEPAPAPQTAVSWGTSFPYLPPELTAGPTQDWTAAADSRMAQVRFLNAVTPASLPLRILEGRRLLAFSLSPQALSPYYQVAAGFRSFSFFDANSPWMILGQATLPLTAGERATLALIPSGDGVEVVKIDDRPCGVQGTGRGCLRCVDLVRNGPPLDLMLTDGRTVFSNLRFKEVSNYRRARPGRYDLYVVQSPAALSVDIETEEELFPAQPVYSWTEPLAAMDYVARAGVQATLYLMGDWDMAGQVSWRLVEN